MRADFMELCKEYGLGTAKTAQLKSALEIGRRLGLTQLDEKYQIKSPADAANLVMMEMAFLDHEQMRILVLDTKNRVVENISRYQGTVNSSVLRAAEVYRPAVIRNCPAVIICHNHPSGDPTPSPEDASQLLARRTGAVVVKLAPSVGSVPAAADFRALFDYNVATLARALSAASN